MSLKGVIIVGCARPYSDPVPDNFQLWACNRAFQQQERIDRLFCLDPLTRFYFNEAKKREFLAGVSARARMVYLQAKEPSIPNSEAYPLERVLAKFGVPYFTSSISYMLALAIAEDAREIVMHRLYSLPGSLEYLQQKACLEFWLGMALGRGIRVSVTSDSHLVRPAPWQPALYAYNDYLDEDYVGKNLCAAARIGMAIPTQGFSVHAVADALREQIAEQITRIPVEEDPMADPNSPDVAARWGREVAAVASKGAGGERGGA